jgi:hypothetical protein
VSDTNVDVRAARSVFGSTRAGHQFSAWAGVQGVLVATSRGARIPFVRGLARMLGCLFLSSFAGMWLAGGVSAIPSSCSSVPRSVIASALGVNVASATDQSIPGHGLQCAYYGSGSVFPFLSINYAGETVAAFRASERQASSSSAHILKGIGQGAYYFKYHDARSHYGFSVVVLDGHTGFEMDSSAGLSNLERLAKQIVSFIKR